MIIYITENIVNNKKYIDKEKLEEYLNNGWVRGRQKI